MTPEEIALIRADGEVIRADADAFARSFYDTLFEIAPQTRALFPDDLTAQRGKVVDELAFLIDSVTPVHNGERLDSFFERARALGRRHVGYGVTGADYAPVQAALTAALRVRLGTWDADRESAWDKLFRLITDLMREGAESARTSDHR